jgi:ribosomal protein L11 methyltransferase
MTTHYTDVHIALPLDESIREFFPTAIQDLGFEGFLEDDRGIHCYIQSELWHEDMQKELEQIAVSFNFPFFEFLSATKIEHKNWNEEWEKTIQPIQVTEKIIITPSWHTVEKKPDQLILTIDPKMTFGTGYHESTRLMLRSMEKYLTSGMKTLDLGTGTGILAIAAAKMGSSWTLGIDIDEWSEENGKENITRNNVEGKVEIRIGSLNVVNENSFDIILANIIRNTILDLLTDMVLKLKPHGILLLSGLLISDREPIETSLHKNNCIVNDVLQENEWICIVAKRN